MSRGGPVVIIIFFFIIILRRMGKNIALAPHTSTYFHTRRVRILTQLLSQPNASWRTLRVPFPVVVVVDFLSGRLLSKVWSPSSHESAEPNEDPKNPKS